VRLRSDVFGERERESCAISMKKTGEREKRTEERETIIFFFFFEITVNLLAVKKMYLMKENYLKRTCYTACTPMDNSIF